MILDSGLMKQLKKYARNVQTTASSVMIYSNVNNAPLDTKFKNSKLLIKPSMPALKSAVMVSDTKLNAMMAIQTMAMVAPASVTNNQDGNVQVDHLPRRVSAINTSLTDLHLFQKEQSTSEIESCKVSEHHIFQNALLKTNAANASNHSK